VEGWVWDAVTARWEDGYAALLAYVAEHGDARVPQKYRTADGNQLGRWVNDQRTAYGRDQLSREQIRRLEAVDGWVWKAS